MANTVNGQTAIYVSSVLYRELSGIDAIGFAGVGGQPSGVTGQVLRARVSLDTAADFTVDDPTVQPAGSCSTNNTTGSDQRIYVVGLRIIAGAATTLTFKSKVGAAAAITLNTEPYATNSGIVSPINTLTPLFSTDLGGALILNSSVVSPTLTALVYYVIATNHVVKQY